MLYKKTLRWREPFGGWNANDTGLGNRIFHWEIAYELNKHNNYAFTILLHKLHWPELEFITLPNTIPFTYSEYENGRDFDRNFQDLRFRTVFDVENDIVFLSSPIDKIKIIDLFSSKVKRFDLSEAEHWHSDFGYNELKHLISDSINYERPLKKIRLKHTQVEDFLKETTKDLIGIHIRRGWGIKYTDKDLTTIPKSLQDEYLKFRLKETVDLLKENENKKETHSKPKFITDDIYFNFIDKILKINSKQKFYISCDLPKEYLANFLEKYGELIVTKEDLIPVTQNFLFTCSDDIKKYHKNYILENLVDLFSLSFCKFLIMSPLSTWSEFAKDYRNIPSHNISEDIGSLIRNYVELFIQKDYFEITTSKDKHNLL